MNLNTWARKLSEYAPANALEQENVLQELVQHHILASLARNDFFNSAVFHGGTCLRIINGLDRFSEDLDFFLKIPDRNFRWQSYLQRVKRDCLEDGIAFEISERENQLTAVQKALLKTDLISTTLIIDLPFKRHNPRKIKVKLEIDTNPPMGSSYDTSYITYPTIAPLTTQTLESGFALKLHALLCRTYVKGRDWFDFIWYLERKITPNLALLKAALDQQGPWAGQAPDMEIDIAWLKKTLRETILRIDWKTAKSDVQRFLPLKRQNELQFWTSDFFLYHCHKFCDTAPNTP